MSERINLGIALGAATGAVLAIGNLAPVTADASASKAGKAALGHTASVELDSVGPNFVSGQDLDNANLQLHVLLDEEGPDGCLAKEIGQGLGVTSQTQLEAIVASDNITFIKQQTVSSHEAPGEIGCNGESPVKVANTHPSSVAYTIAANKIPSASEKYVKKTKAGYVLQHELIDQSGEDALLEGAMKLPKQPVSNNISVDVSYGISEDIAGVLPTAPMPVRTTLISGKNMSYTTFQADFQEDFSEAEAAAKPVAVTPPPATEAPSEPAEPTQPPATPPTAPTPTQPTSPTSPSSPTYPFSSGEVGYDISYPNCDEAEPTGADFGIVGVTDGLGYSTNPCLSQEFSYFTDPVLYTNTGWNSDSSHISSTSPDMCASGDEDCLAYNYGYNDAIYAVQAATAAGASSTTWMLDVEPPGVNTWSSDPIQNRNSLQGQYDGLIAQGVQLVMVYGTTAGWDDLTDDWMNNWASEGATTVTTPSEAETYCEGHEFTGGPTELIQFQGQDPEGDAIDEDYAC